MHKAQFPELRKSHLSFDEIYFWTATINNWQKLLLTDRYKDIIIDSLQYLSNESKINLFGFVIMPNHIHLIWKMLEPNGKETAQGSFLKYTAHKFRQMLIEEDKKKLIPYKVNANNKKHEFWQRDPLAIPLFTREVAYQKLNYIHNNPLAKHWKLAEDPCEYRYSSASYYEANDNRYSFLKDLRDEF